MLNKNILRKILIILLAMLLFMHFGVLIEIIPKDIVWGGKILSNDKIVFFEILSILILGVIIVTLLMDGKYLKPLIPEKLIRIILWVYFTLFLLNTIGNVLATTFFEKLLSILTIIFSILIYFILNKNNKSNTILNAKN